MPELLSQKRLLEAAMVLVFSACTGGCSPGSDGADTANDQVEPNTLVHDNTNQAVVDQDEQFINGTIIIEERNGKTIFDAYFTKSVLVEGYAGIPNSVSSTDTCNVRKLHSIVSKAGPVKLGAANGDADFASIGDAITIDSRVGQFEALIKQHSGQVTVYAPENRWRSIALPEDASVSFDNSPMLDKLGSIQMPPLKPLVWLAPSTGVMTNPAAALKWEASLDEQTRIKLRVSSLDFTDSEKPEVVTVSCDLVDDGTFTLPAQYQTQLPDDEMGIVVYAVRERIQEIRVDQANLTVVQLSYPAPLKP